MKIIKITPRGYCCGVASALFKAKKVARDAKSKNIFMLGSIIHNDFAVEQLKSLNIKLLSDETESRLSLLKNKVPNNSTVIFSAHGTPENVFELAKEKKCSIVDTTCIYVKQTHNIIKNYLKENYTVLFIGKKYHPETEAILAIDKNIIFLETIEDAFKIKVHSNKIVVTNQTTLSVLDCEEIVKILKSRFKNIIYENEICDATYLRQKAILNLKDQDVQLLLVVGDIKSNNSKKLVEIGKKMMIKSFLIRNESDVKSEMFLNVRNIAITSGASTPFELTEIITNKVKTMNN